MYIISACLLGENCKYNGGNNRCRWVVDFAEKHSHVKVCPETEGGMSTPRLPSEIAGDKVVNRAGEDVTQFFLNGASKSYERAKTAAAERGEPIEGAILKAKSPSCGYGRIYDGTFSKTLTDGDGLFARLLIKDDIKVITEKENIEND